MQKAETVFAFDFGKASLGEAVKVSDEIAHAASLLIPEDFASISEQRTRRRAYRTRLSHKEREKELKKICGEAGIEILRGRDQQNGIPGDKRLEKEFPSKNENICYTSCLLRIKLLRGEKLEGWQIYKALHSAIQRRGYDKDIPWKNSSGKKTDDEKDSEGKSELFQKEYMKMSPNPEHHYPCYRDAYEMGLWDPGINAFKDKIDCHAGRARGYTAPRKEVEKEIRALIRNAAAQFPYLKDKENQILYGPGGEAYKSSKEVLGILGQKAPRFDNRMPDKCRLIPRLNVCSASDILAMQVTFLMKLKNMRLQREQSQLSHEELAEIFNAALKKYSALKKENGNETPPDKVAKCFQFTESAWKKLCHKLGGEALINEDEVEAPKFSGRSSFSRPALRLMKELILSGKSPHSFHKEKIEEIKSGKIKGILEKDLDFLLKMPDDWCKIHIPSQAFEAFRENSASNEEAVRKLIGSVGDPIVRHRLELFSKRLDELAAKFGQPQEIVMEFVRTDFMGPKALKKFEVFQKERKTRRQEASEMAEALGLSGSDAILKAELFIQQSGQDPYPMKTSQCVYTGACLEQTNISSWHIDHIVPRRGKYHGSNSNLNLVLTTREANTEKADRTPYEWLSGSGRWDAFTARVNSMKNMYWKKKNRLLMENAPEEDEKQTALIETAWIAKLAQSLASLKYGYTPGAEGEKRFVTVIPGGLTAKVRKKYKLNQILYKDLPDDADIEELPKNRQDSRHHALDAMVLAFLPQWARDINKREFFKFPPNVLKNPKGYFSARLETLTPYYICREKPTLEETFYGRRNSDNKPIVVKRVELASLPYKGKSFSSQEGSKQASSIFDSKIKSDLLAFFSGDPSEENWKNFVSSYKFSPEGPIVKKVSMIIGEPSEYCNISKGSALPSAARGQYKRAKSHNGYFIYLDKGKPKVRPVYVFQSKNKVKQELIKEGYEIYGFFCSNCLVEISQDVDLGNRIIPKGRYVCSTIQTVGRAKLKGNGDAFKNEIGLKYLINAGLKRIL